MLSMTGYASFSNETPKYTIQVDIKSINSKYTDLKLNAGFCNHNFLEKLRQIILKKIYRGQVTVDLYLKLNQDDDLFNLNFEQLERYIQGFENKYDECVIRDFTNLKSFFHFPNLCQKNSYSFDEEIDGKSVTETVLNAINQFYQSRLAEGENLRKDFSKKLEQLLNICNEIESQVPNLERVFCNRLEKRIRELVDTIDEVDTGRILNEVAIFATKTTIDEELVRLKSHINKLQSIIESTDNVVGKRIDFYMQEINREFNTIASKISDLEISKKIVDAKVLVDQIREQVQNII